MAKFESLLNEIKDKFKNDTKRKCSHCGATFLSDDSLFCHVCGAKRNQCSCGTLIYEGMKFCPRCGKITPLEQQRQEEERKAQEEENRRREEENRIRAREAILKSDPKNFLNRGDYIELVNPICGIRMIQNGNLERQGIFFKYAMFSWGEAKKLAKELDLGGFKDWRIPTIEELRTVYQIQNICGLNKVEGIVWSLSTSSFLKRVLCIDFSRGNEWEVFPNNQIFYVLCVR